jgi:hypothetical protein
LETIVIKDGSTDKIFERDEMNWSLDNGEVKWMVVESRGGAIGVEELAMGAWLSVVGISIIV